MGPRGPRTEACPAVELVGSWGSERLVNSRRGVARGPGNRSTSGYRKCAALVSLATARRTTVPGHLHGALYAGRHGPRTDGRQQRHVEHRRRRMLVCEPLNFGATLEQQRPNTRENQASSGTRRRSQASRLTTLYGLQNLHPRFKSGRRLQIPSEIRVIGCVPASAGDCLLLRKALEFAPHSEERPL